MKESRQVFVGRGLRPARMWLVMTTSTTTTPKREEAGFPPVNQVRRCGFQKAPATMLSIGPGETGPKTSRDFNSIQSLLSSVFRCATARNDLLVKKRGGSGSIEPASKTDVTPEYNSLIPLPLCCQMFEITENYLKEQYDITTVHNQIT